MSTEPICGGCLCGAARYEAALPILTRRQCWCRVCQFLACGSASTNIFVHSGELRVTGNLAEYRSVADSGSHLVRTFCPKCGTHLFSAADERPDFVAIRGGSLDDPNLAAPELVIWTDSAPEWACIDQDLPTDARQPPPLASTAGRS